MKTNLNLRQTRIFCAVALRLSSFSGLAAATENSADTPPAATAIPWAQLRAKAAANPTFSDANWISMGGFPGANGSVDAAVVDGSGNLYIGGEFTCVGDAIANGIAKWDGSSWTGLGSGIAGVLYEDSPHVNALAVSGSNVYAGGHFKTAGGVSAPYIAKWNGSSWTALGSGINGPVSALAVSGSDLYAGGAFTTAGGVSAHYIAKWNGSTWSTLGSGVTGGGGEGLTRVYALAVSGSDLYAGGAFTTAGGSSATNIAKWDGSSWSALGSGVTGGGGEAGSSVKALAVSGSDLYAGGIFTTAGGSAANGIGKWNGSSWSALGSGVTSGGDEVGTSVKALAVSGSDLYAGGIFTTAGGSAANRVAKWNGSSWSALGSGMNGTDPYGQGPSVSALAVSGSDLYAGGVFTTASGSVANSIAKWNGSSWSAMHSVLGSGMDGGVSALAVSGSDLYAGGGFMTAGGSAASYIAKWNGSSWSGLGSGMDGGGVSALAVSGSDLYAGGQFTTAGGVSANHIAKWNGSSWTVLGSGMAGGGERIFGGPSVYALAVSGSDLYAAGSFTTAGGYGANNVAKWNGSSWSALGSGIDDVVFALAVSGSDLYAVRAFTTAGGHGANNVAKWNGSSWTALGSTRDGPVSRLAVVGSDLYAAGYFYTAGGGAPLGIAKWNGSSWTALGSGIGINSAVSALAVSGSDLYAGGGITTAAGSAANGIAKWNGTNWSALGSGIDGQVSALAVSGSDLYAGGYFTTAGGKVSANIARAYLLTLPALSVLRSGPKVLVSWPSVDTTGFSLEEAGTLAAPAGWVANTASVTDTGTNKSVTLPATTSPQFFRLRRP
jgi:hypothetical protein